MKKMNKKGFTLIELLAVIIIMGVLLLVAVPSVSKYITNSRIDTYETNLARMVDAVKTEVNSYSNDAYSFSASEVLIVPLHCIELESGNTEKSPFANYVKTSSFIMVDRKVDANGIPVGFKYYITALDESGYGSVLSLAEDAKVVTMASGTSGNVSTISYKSGKYSVALKGGVTLPTDAAGKTKTIKILGDCTLGIES